MKKFIICHQDGHPIWPPQLYDTWEEAAPLVREAWNNAVTYNETLFIDELDDSNIEDKKIIEKYSKKPLTPTPKGI